VYLWRIQNRYPDLPPTGLAGGIRLMEIHRQHLSEKDREQEAFQSTVKNQHSAIMLRLVRQLEVDGNLRLDLHRIPIEQIGFVLPLLHRIHRGSRQTRISTHNLYC